MIVFDASSLVGAVFRANSVPELALDRAADTDTFALSREVDSEIEAVLARPKFASRISLQRRGRILQVLRAGAAWFDPAISIQDCRDPKDDMYLALALTAGAATLVSSDADLLVLDPWRGIRILNPRSYLGLEIGTNPKPVNPPGAHSP